MSFPNIFMGYTTMYWSLYTVCITGAIVQIILLICLLKDPLRCFRNSASYLVANLAICDLIVDVLMLMGTMNSGKSYVQALSHVPYFASFLSLLSIAVDRYFIVVHPFKHRSYMSGMKTTIWIAFIWIFSFCDPVYHILTDTVDELSYFKYFLMAVVVILTSFAYVLTFISLKRDAKYLSSNGKGQSCQTRIINEKKFLNTIIVIGIVAVLCVTPVTVYGAVKHLDLDKDMRENVLFCFLSTILCLNFALNPVVYFLRLKNYRKTFFILFCQKK